MSDMNLKKPILEVRDLKQHFPIESGLLLKRQVGAVRAVDGISFDLLPGETLGIVGESGCGKSTTVRAISQLYTPTSGSVILDGLDLLSATKKETLEARKNMQMIFQDPYSSLNPRKKVAKIIGQSLDIHSIGTSQERSERIEHLMQEVGLNPLFRGRYPHQFSGGQRQRIGIARALALQPEFVVCDEAVSALDVSVQAQILNLLLDLQEKHNLTYMFIAHDLAVVEFISTRILVMYLGRVVEIARKEDLVARHVHPYTRALFIASPITSPDQRKGEKHIFQGDVPSPINPPTGCHFHPRCPYAIEQCRKEYPPMKEVAPGHFAACWVV